MILQRPAHGLVEADQVEVGRVDECQFIASVVVEIGQRHPDRPGRLTTGDTGALSEAVSRAVRLVAPGGAPPALRQAISRMVTVAESADSDPDDVCGARSAEWLAASREARHGVVRMSLELRMVVSLES